MEKINLLISDETLRDGEQQVGLFFDDKESLAHLIAQTGVHHIALMPAIHPTEEQIVKSLVNHGLSHQVIASTMMKRTAIDQSKACGVQQIILFNAVSDRLLFLRDSAVGNDPTLRNKTIDDDIPTHVIQTVRQTMLDQALEHVQYAHAQGLRICFAAEDASRADFSFLVDCINTLTPYIDEFLVCDTVGTLTPEKSFVWIHDLLEYTQPARLSVHFHNDMGMAVENTIQAIQAGATGVSGTFCGIGERAGNVPIEQVLRGLRVRFGCDVEGIDYDAIDRIVDEFRRQRWQPHPPYSRQAQRQESGIHVHSLLRDRHSYSIFPYGCSDIWFGKCSGISNFQYLFEHHLNQPLERSQYEELREAVKAIAIEQNRSFSADEVIDLIHTHQLLLQ